MNIKTYNDEWKQRLKLMTQDFDNQSLQTFKQNVETLMSQHDKMEIDPLQVGHLIQTRIDPCPIQQKAGLEQIMEGVKKLRGNKD